MSADSSHMSPADFERFFALSPDLLCVAGFDGHFKRLNPAWSTTLGWTLDELLSRPWLDFVHPDDRPAAIDAGSTLSGGTTVVSFVNRYRCRDGSYKSLRWACSPDQNSETIYAVVHDITESVETHAALQKARDEFESRIEERTQALTRKIAEHSQAEERFRLLIESVRDYAIYIIDPSGRIATWNAGAERIKGYSEDEILGQHVRRFYPQEVALGRKPDDHLRDALAAGRLATEGWRVRKDGTRFCAHVVVTPLYDDDGNHVGFAKVTRDLTEQRQLEAQLRQAQKMEAVGRLAGGVAHDFNNILSVVLSYAEIISVDLKPDDPLRIDIEEIRTAGLRATDLTRQLLAFSRQQVLEPRVLNLNQSIGAMDSMLSRLLGADIELTMLPAGGLWNVMADPGQVEQIIMNLAVNARDAMPQGGKLTIETGNVELDDDYANAHHDVRPGFYVMLAVSDTGVGMDAETLTRIFEPFFTTKAKNKGTGLGLATVFGIVKQSGGSIWVYSEPGSGTTFKVYLPKVVGSVEVLPSRRPAPTSGRGSGTILLVEDDHQVRALARGILRRNGYTVLEAANGGEALLVCEQHGSQIQLLLTDVVLPRMSGRQLAERLAPMRPDMKVLFMSGYTDDAILQHGVLNSGVAFLQKPLMPAALTRKVREVMATGRTANTRLQATRRGANRPSPEAFAEQLARVSAGCTASREHFHLPPRT